MAKSTKTLKSPAPSPGPSLHPVSGGGKRAGAKAGVFSLSASQVNAGYGPHFDVLEVGHPDYVALINADTAFRVLSPRAEALEYLLGGELPKSYLEKEAKLAADLETVRFKLLPSAVYFNPTERCNLDCDYCYLPREARKRGHDMDPARLMEALAKLKDFFINTLPEGARPQLVFHGSEPLLAEDAVFRGIEKFGDYFRFGVQTNTVLLDQEAIDFLKDARRGHRHFARRPHRGGGGPHPAHLGRPRRLCPDRQGPGEAHRLPRLQHHHHRHQGKRAVPPGAGGFLPRAGGAQRPAQPGAGDTARLAGT